MIETLVFALGTATVALLATVAVLLRRMRRLAPTERSREVEARSDVLTAFPTLVGRVGALEAEAATLRRLIDDADRASEKRYRSLLGTMTGPLGGRPRKHARAEEGDSDGEEYELPEGADQIALWNSILAQTPGAVVPAQGAAPPRNGDGRGRLYRR